MPSVARNTTWLTGAFIFQKVLAFIYFTLIARYTGATFTGSYVFAISFTTIFAIFVDIGFSPVLVRDIARDKNKAKELLYNILGIKTLLGVMTFLVIVISIGFIEQDMTTRIMVYLAGFLMLADTTALTFWSVMRGLHDLRFEAMGIMAGQAITFAIGLGGLLYGYPLYILVAAMLAGSTFNALFSGIIVKKKLQIPLRLHLSKAVLKNLFKIAYPFALLHVFTKLIFTLDQVLLSHIVGKASLGFYAVAFKITFALQFIPSAVAAALFPAMSHHYAKEEHDRLAYLFERSMIYLVAIAVPLCIGVILLSPELIGYVYTETFKPSVLTLQIIIWSALLLFISFPLGALLNATNNHMKNAQHLGIAVFINIVLNLILLPRIGHNGAAIASVTAWVVLVALNGFHARKVIPIRMNFFAKKGVQIVLASVVMAAGVNVLKLVPVPQVLEPAYLFIAIPFLAATLYAALLLLFGTVTIAGLQDMKQKFLKR